MVRTKPTGSKRHKRGQVGNIQPDESVVVLWEPVGQEVDGIGPVFLQELVLIGVLELTVRVASNRQEVLISDAQDRLACRQ